MSPAEPTEPSEPSRRSQPSQPAEPDERISVADLVRRHPESAPPTPPPAAARRVPRWKAFVDFGFLLLVALGGLTWALWIALGAAVVGTGLGGQRIHVVDVVSGNRGGAVGRVDAPAALAGRTVDVDRLREGTYYEWPANSGQAFSRGWGFLAAEWIPLVAVLLCAIAVSVIVRVLWRLGRHPADEV